MFCISSRQEELNCESIVTLENHLGDAESRRVTGKQSVTYIEGVGQARRAEKESCNMGTDGDNDRNLVFEHELAPGQDDDDGQAISGMEAIENKLHRERGQPDDLNGDDQEIDRHDDDMKRDKAKARHAESGAQQRKGLLSLAKQEPGSAVVNARGKVVDGLKWQNGQLVDRSWTEHPAFRESVRRQNVFQRAEDQFQGRRGPSFNEAGYAPPDPQAPDYREVKAVGGVATTSIKRRLSKPELEKRGRLLKLATGIRDAVTRGERAAAGAMLREAKALLGHGHFLQWVEQETGLEPRSVQRYIEAAGL
jgi:hypothetical protein